MTASDGLLHPEPLPVERILFDSPLVRVGMFRCPSNHPLFSDSGPIVNAVFAFPRTALWIQHEGRAPFLSDPTIATLYNRGQTYRRRPLGETGDHCEWFALAPHVLAEVAALHDAAAIERPERPFASARTPVDSRTYLVQRQLVHSLLASGAVDPLAVEETVIWLATRVLAAAADRRGLPAPARASSRAARAQRDQVEHVRRILTLRFEQSWSLTALAAHAGISVFHLCRIFRRHTGLTLHEYRTELRLRHALAWVPDRRADLTRVALELGFSSHSHFTAVFRRAFGVTPSGFARQSPRLRDPRA